MKIQIAFFFALFVSVLNAQEVTFDLLSEEIPEKLSQGAVQLSDVDGDSDMDLLITGLNVDDVAVSKLYLNDGQGEFTLSSATFFGVYLSDHQFTDVDGDDDLDVLLAGRVSDSQLMTILYLNDGNGNFSPSSSVFTGVEYSSLDFADVDMDNDQDVLITGSNSSPKTLLYLNDGLGNFTLNANTPFPDIQSGCVKFSDIDGDNDPDLLLMGRNEFLNGVSGLFINDGNGNFTEQPNSPFLNLYNSSIDFGDIDNDGDKDVITMGTTSGFGGVVKLYLNDGSGLFTLSDQEFITVYGNAVVFSDFNNDSFLDILLSGHNSNLVYKTRVYLNIENGGFTELSGTNIHDSYSSASVAIGLVDADSKVDFVISGFNSNFSGKTTHLYLNSTLIDDVYDADLCTDIDIFPNPTQNDVFINSDQILEINEVTLYSSDGQLIRQMHYGGSLPFKITLDGEAGIYFIHLKSNDFYAVKRILKLN